MLVSRWFNIESDNYEQTCKGFKEMTNYTDTVPSATQRLERLCNLVLD